MSDKEPTEELVVVDVHRYRKVKNALKDSEARYRLFFENIPIGIFHFSADGKILDANPALLKMLGYSSSAEIDPKNLGEKNKNILKILREFCNKIESQNEFRSFDLTWRKKDNTLLFIRVNARIVSANDNNVLFYEGMVEDISERKRAESQREAALEALEKSSQLLRDTGEMAKVGGWELDLSTQEVQWTEEVYRIHGVEPGYNPKLEEAVNFYVPESRPALEAALKKTAETGEPFDLESLFIPQGSKDKIWVRSIGRAVYSDGKITKLAGTFQNIDKYKRAEEALRESEEKYRTLFTSSSDAIMLIEPLSGKFISGNQTMMEMFGLKNDDDFSSFGPWDFSPERQPDGRASAEKAKEMNEIAMRDGSNFFEWTHKRLNGEELSANVRLTRMVLDKKTILQATVRDITERKHAEEEIKMLATALKRINECVSITDVENIILFVNEAFLKTYGYSEQELIGQNIKIVRPPNSPQKVFEEVLPGTLSGGWTGELVNRRKDGSEFPIFLSTTIIEKKDGKPNCLIGIAIDITERKRAESQRAAALEALRKTEENFRRSLDESPLGVRIVTAKGETIYANQALLDFYDYNSIAELNQIPLRERYTPKSYGEYKKRRKIRESGKFGPSEYEVSIVRKNGDVRQLQVFRKAVLWNGVKQFQALYRDITESKHWLETIGKFEKTIQGQKMLLDQQSSSVEELIERLTRSREELGASYRELKAKKDDLVRSEKLAFTGRMAAGIAHEIRNPLTNVILSIQQLKKDEKIKPEVLKYAEIVERNTERMEYLITELLNCARPIKLNRQPGDIHLLIKDILNVHKVRLKTQRIKVLQNLTSHHSTLLFDKEQLGRVFLNLIANAIDAMRKGGKLSIATKSEKKKFLIKIQDNGSGIPEKNMIKLFDPFFSTKKGGAGLGLSICQNIVSSHGGQIEVESAWRKGSVFSVSLPIEPKLLDRKENMAGKS